MRVVVEAHVLGLVERRLDRVVAGRAVVRIPVRDGWTRGDRQHVALLRQLGTLDGQAGLRFVGVDLALPTLREDSASGDSLGRIPLGHAAALLRGALDGEGQSNNERERRPVDQTHSDLAEKGGDASLYNAGRAPVP
jgi:hypothetical protein